MPSHVLLLATIAAFGALWYWKRPDISPGSAKALIAKGGVLVDVRSPGEFAAGHLAGARNLPLDRIGKSGAELGPRDKPIVLYCKSGARSAMAARTLRSAGYTQVSNLGAMSNW